jgi:serine/threonine-protein kinase
MLSNVLYLVYNKKFIITPYMYIKQKPGEVTTQATSSPTLYFVIVSVLVLLFSSLSISTLLYNPQLAAAIKHSSLNKEKVKSNFLIYENPTYGIRIKYPANWEKMESQDFEGGSNKHIIEFKLLPQNHLQSEDLAALHIYIHNLPAPSIVDQLTRFFDKSSSQRTLLEGFVLSRFTSILAKNLPDFDFIKSESDATSILADNPSHKIVYKYREGQNDIKVMEDLTVKNDKGYIIVYVAKASKYSYYLPIMQKMMNSFEIK